MFISKKRWKQLEKRVDDLEKVQRQPVKIDSKMICDACKTQLKRIGNPTFN